MNKEKLCEQTTWRIWRDQEKSYVVKGRYGVISQYRNGDLDVLVLSVRIALKFERAGWKAKNHYDDGTSFIRPWRDLDHAARSIRAHRKRHLSPEQRDAVSQLFAKARLERKTSHVQRSLDLESSFSGSTYPENPEMIPTREVLSREQQITANG